MRSSHSNSSSISKDLIRLLEVERNGLPKDSNFFVYLFIHIQFKKMGERRSSFSELIKYNYNSLFLSLPSKSAD